MCHANMLVVLCLVAGVLQWGLVEGRKGCWADAMPPGAPLPDECLSGTTMPGSSEMMIVYRFTSTFARICCQALRCEWWDCYFVDVGCGQGSSPFQTSPLPWEASNVEPAMRCYRDDTSRRGAYYSYTYAPYASG